MIELRSDILKALVSPVGATLAGLWATPYPHSLVLGSSDQNAYGDHLAYFGALVGPIANRVTGGLLTIAGQDWELEQNEGDNALHSGSCGLHALKWDIVSALENSVTFSVHLGHGFGGLPGNRRIDATYTLSKETLRLEIMASSDAATAMNIAHHPYWNLDGTASIADHKLFVPANSYLPTDSARVPTGNVSPVQGTSYDFREIQPVPTSYPLDSNLCLGTKRLETPRKCARLTAPTGPSLEIFSTEPGLQVYNGSGLHDVPVSLFDRRKLAPFAGIALEPQNWPDAPKHKHFPSICLRDGVKYCQITEYRICFQSV